MICPGDLVAFDQLQIDKIEIKFLDYAPTKAPGNSHYIDQKGALRLQAMLRNKVEVNAGRLYLVICSTGSRAILYTGRSYNLLVDCEVLSRINLPSLYLLGMPRILPGSLITLREYDSTGDEASDPFTKKYNVNRLIILPKQVLLVIATDSQGGWITFLMPDLRLGSMHESRFWLLYAPVPLRMNYEN